MAEVIVNNSYYNNKLNIHFLDGSFERGLILIPEIKKGIKDFSNQIDPHHIMMFYYKIACIYFSIDTAKFLSEPCLKIFCYLNPKLRIL